MSYPRQIDKKFISTHTLTWSVTLATPEYKSAFAISTHTLTWSVTDVFPKSRQTDRISTHTLTWSVTPRLSAYLTPKEFQLTRSRGA